MPSKSLTALEEKVGDSITAAKGFRVDHDKIAEFARAIKDPNPVYRDQEAACDRGFNDVPAPLTFTRAAEFPRYRTDEFTGTFGFNLGFDPTSTLHGTQSYEFYRPVQAGDVLSSTATLRDVYRRESDRRRTMTFAVIEQVFEDADGEPVVTVGSTYIEVSEVDEK